MKAIIGIVASMEVNTDRYHVSLDHITAITRAGGIPIVLPYTKQLGQVKKYLELIDGLYLIGGDDLDPDYYGKEPIPELGPVLPERDEFEIKMTEQALAAGKPFLGVCRGAQILNVAMGGDMYQDIQAEYDTTQLQHTQKAPKEHGSHHVNILKGSRLHQLTKRTTLKVNSWHHQANKSISPGYQVVAQANDGIIEAIESKESLFVLGVQWHPEIMAGHDDLASIRIYQGFIQACEREEVK